MKIIHRLLFIFAVVALLVLPAQAGPSDSSFDGVLNATYTIEKHICHIFDRYHS
jgi:hypothetical protein